ncbi:MAG TPA: membrane protein insertase YidC [Bryobacteraceae bacterium]|nr:membrane protein insertase YidC [Bryobacteraceae bacterium]
MADIENVPIKPGGGAPGTPGGGKKKELSMEMRLLLAFLLMGLVLFLTPYIYKAPPPPKKPVTPPIAAQVTPEQKTSAPAQAAAAPTEPVPGQIQASGEQEFIIDTADYRIRFVNRGAVVTSWVLKKYPDRSGKPLELVNPGAAGKVPHPLSLFLKDQQATSVLNSALFSPKPASDGLGIDYEFSDGKYYAKKTVRFAKNSYLSQITTEVKINGTPAPHQIEWRGGFGDATVLNRAGEQHAVHYDLTNGKLVTKDAKSAKDGPVDFTGNFSFAGLDDRFFAFVLLPQDNTSTQVEVVKDDVPAAPGGKDEPHAGVRVGGDSVNHFSMFVGPKDVDLLRNVDPKLQQLIDWGWFGIIAKPIFLALHWLNDNAIHNYGWSIVVITIIINLVLLPLRFSSMKSQKKMQKLQPQIAAINAKYKGLSLRDPKKAEQNAEIMELYKREGANPMSGCLPMFIQIPILYAFYKVLTVTIELRGAHWLWVTDLSQPEQLAIHVLPIVMVITQFIQQKMTPNPSVDPSQAKMMQFMPLMFGFFFYNMSSGLVLYWLTSNLVGILQQWLVNKSMPTPAPVEVPKIAAKKKSRG